MCGRITLTKPKQIDFTLFGIPNASNLPASYNIAPGRSIAVIREHPNDAHRELVSARWGLLPHWCEDPKVNFINARSETASAKPAFRTALAHRRCLILADGFYEWKKSVGKNQPYYISMKNGQPFAFAGIWECWRNKTQVIRSCSILTTRSNGLLESIHERMPVIIQPKDYDLWLDSRVHNLKRIQRLMRRWPSSQMKAFPVSLYVNDPRYDDPQCIELKRDEPAFDTTPIGFIQPTFAMMMT